MNFQPGTVILSLSDVELMKQEVKDRDIIIKQKDVEIAEKVQQVAEVEADKRIVKIVERTEVQKAFSQIRISSELAVSFAKEVSRIFNSYPTHSVAEKISSLINGTIAQAHSSYERGYDTGYRQHFDHFGHNLGRSYPDTPKVSKQTEKSYINFEDVQRELREIAELAVSKELGELRTKVNAHSEKISQLKEKHSDEISALEVAKVKEITSLKQNHSQDLETIENRHKSEIADITEKRDLFVTAYENLKFDRDTRTTEKKLQDSLDEANKQLLILKNRGFWSRLFNR